MLFGLFGLLAPLPLGELRQAVVLLPLLPSPARPLLRWLATTYGFAEHPLGR